MNRRKSTITGRDLLPYAAFLLIAIELTLFRVDKIARYQHVQDESGVEGLKMKDDEG